MLSEFPTLPARFCLEFVDLVSFTDKHRAEIGRYHKWIITDLHNIYVVQRVLTDYRGPGFLAVISFSSTPTPSPSSPVSKLDRRLTEWQKREATCWREKGGIAQESLALYKSFNPLQYCMVISTVVYFILKTQRFHKEEKSISSSFLSSILYFTDYVRTSPLIFSLS